DRHRRWAEADVGAAVGKTGHHFLDGNVFETDIDTGVAFGVTADQARQQCAGKGFGCRHPHDPPVQLAQIDHAFDRLLERGQRAPTSETSTRRVLRLSRRTPSRVSSSLTRPLSAACDRCMLWAASEKLPRSSTAMNACSCLMVISTFMRPLTPIFITKNFILNGK